LITLHGFLIFSIQFFSGPMAFTIDFGGNDSEESEKKKLSLRDGIRRFAPSKKTKPPSHTVTVVTSAAANATSHTSVTTSSQSARMVSLPVANNTNDYVTPPKQHNSSVTTDKYVTMTSSTSRAVVVDKENNIQPSEIVQQATRAAGGDAASEAGTYTIDQVRGRL
jgi:hypothetical protein